MQSKALDVDTYIQEAQPERQESLMKLHALCKEILVGYEEVMEYGMPGYNNDGMGEVGFANQKNYISLYILKETVVEQNRSALKDLNVGKGCIRYPNPKKMDFEVIRKLLLDTVQSGSAPC